MNKDSKIKDLECFDFEDVEIIGNETKKQQEQFKNTVLDQVEKVIAAKTKELSDKNKMYEELE